SPGATRRGPGPTAAPASAWPSSPPWSTRTTAPSRWTAPPATPRSPSTCPTATPAQRRRTTRPGSGRAGSARHAGCMTPVRQSAANRTNPRGTGKAGGLATTKASKTAGRRDSRAGKAAPARRKASTRTGGASQVAQVRLQADEMAVLQHVIQQLRLPSTSEALREGIRLLIREAGELAAAEQIRYFYGDIPAPVPDGAVRATEEDLAAADSAQW